MISYAILILNERSTYSDTNIMLFLLVSFMCSKLINFTRGYFFKQMIYEIKN